MAWGESDAVLTAPQSNWGAGDTVVSAPSASLTPEIQKAIEASLTSMNALNTLTAPAEAQQVQDNESVNRAIRASLEASQARDILTAPFWAEVQRPPQTLREKQLADIGRTPAEAFQALGEQINPMSLGIPHPVGPQKGVLKQAGAALANFPVDVANFALSPAGIATLEGFPALAPAAKKLAGTILAAQQTAQGITAPTLQEKIESYLGAGLAGAGAAKFGREPIAKADRVPERAAPQVPSSETGVPSQDAAQAADNIPASAPIQESPVSSSPEAAPRSPQPEPSIPQQIGQFEAALQREIAQHGEGNIAQLIRQHIESLKQQLPQEETPNATQTGIESQNRQPEYPGIPPREQVPADITGARESDRRQAGDSGQPQPETAVPAPAAAQEPVGQVPEQTGISNERLYQIYGEDAVAIGRGRGPKAWQQIGQADKRDPYAVLSQAKQRGIAPPEDVAALRAEHQRLLDAARNAYGTPQYDELAQRAVDMANATKSVAHGPASDVFRVLQDVDTPKYDSPADFDNIVRERMNRESTPQEKEVFQRVSDEVAKSNGEMKRIATDAQKRIEKYRPKEQMRFDDAADFVRKEIARLTKDCVI